MWACAIILGGLYAGLVPQVNRSVLFLLPWLGAAGLTLLPANRLVQTSVFGLMAYGLATGSNGQWLRVKKDIWLAQDKVEGARTLHETWGLKQAAPVMFRPQWAAPEYLSSLVDLRFASTSSLDDGPVPLPPMYAVREGGECGPGERGVAYVHGRQVCDCPVEAETKRWIAYACPE